jgi:hypothetical protein
MAVRQPRYSKEEFAQRGNALYEAQIRSQVEEGNQGELWRSTSKLERLSLPTIRLLLPIISRSVSLMLNLG